MGLTGMRRSFPGDEDRHGLGQGLEGLPYEGKAIKGNAGEFAVDEHKSQGGCGEITAFLQ